MTNLQDCLQEIIAKGSGYFIRSSFLASAHEATEWESTALLDDMWQKSPGVLDDHAWTEWTIRQGIGSTCAIHYGIRGSSLGHRDIPGYGRLRAFEQSQRRHASTGESGDGSRTPLSRLLGY